MAQTNQEKQQKKQDKRQKKQEWKDKRYLTDMTAKELFWMEIDKLRQMSFKEKLDHIWSYYKPLMAGIIGVIMVIMIIVQSYQNSKIEEVLYVAWINAGSLNTDNSQIYEDFAERIELDEKTQTLTFDASMYIDYDGSSEATYSSVMKITTLVAAQQMDVMVAPQEVTNNYVHNDMFADLTEVLPEELLEVVEPYLLETEIMERDYVDEQLIETPTGRHITYGINLGSVQILEDEGVYYRDDIVLSITVNTNNMETAIDFIAYLFGM